MALLEIWLLIKKTWTCKCFKSFKYIGGGESQHTLYCVSYQRNCGENKSKGKERKLRQHAVFQLAVCSPRLSFFPHLCSLDPEICTPHLHVSNDCNTAVHTALLLPPHVFILLSLSTLLPPTFLNWTRKLWALLSWSFSLDSMFT